jgi:hypothetical protein
MLPRAVGQPPPGDLLLGGGQLGWAAWDGPGEQKLSSAFSIRGDPTADRPGIDPKELGNLLDGISIQDSLDGQQATVLMFFGRASASHPRESTRAKRRRTLLS